MPGNMLKDFIDDEAYGKLKKMGFLNERAVRDYYIRKRFNSLRNQSKPRQIIKELQKEFPYLAIDSIRKIAYTKTANKARLDS